MTIAVDLGRKATIQTKLIGITKCSNMEANILPGDDPPGQNSTFSEQCHVAYQNKVNRECSNIVEGMGSKFIFSEHGHVAYQFYWNHKI